MGLFSYLTIIIIIFVLYNSFSKIQIEHFFVNKFIKFNQSNIPSIETEQFPPLTNKYYKINMANNKIFVDLFHTIFNQYNPYINQTTTIQNILKDKCYIKYINNFLLYDEKPWLRGLTYQTIIDNIVNIGSQFNIVISDDSSNIISLQNSYINNFINNSYFYSKKNNIRFGYYSELFAKQTFYSVPLLLTFIYKSLIDKKMDDLKWIDMVLSVFINNNIVYNMTNNPLTETKYNFVYIFASYILEELKVYSSTIFSQTNDTIKKETSIISVDINSTLYEIKNEIFYNDDGKYFEKNIIFDCLI